MPEYGYPERAGSEFHLLIDGERYSPAILRAIEAAHSNVLMEMYLVESSGQEAEKFIAAFSAAFRCDVCVHPLLDVFGSRKFTCRDRDRLLRSGARLAGYNPLSLPNPRRSLLRTHRKYLQADASVAFVGGSGIADSFSGPQAWREIMVEVRACCERLARAVRHDLEALVRPAGTGSPAGAALRGECGWPGGLDRGRKHKPRNQALSAQAGAPCRAGVRMWLASACFVPSRRARRAEVCTRRVCRRCRRPPGSLS